MVACGALQAIGTAVATKPVLGLLLRHSAVTSLNLRGNDLSSAKPLAASISRSTRLTALDLSHNRFGLAATAALAAVLPRSSISRLVLEVRGGRLLRKQLYRLPALTEERLVLEMRSFIGRGGVPPPDRDGGRARW